MIKTKSEITHRGGMIRAQITGKHGVPVDITVAEEHFYEWLDEKGILDEVDETDTYKALPANLKQRYLEAFIAWSTSRHQPSDHAAVKLVCGKIFKVMRYWLRDLEKDYETINGYKIAGHKLQIAASVCSEENSNYVSENNDPYWVHVSADGQSDIAHLLDVYHDIIATRVKVTSKN